MAAAQHLMGVGMPAELARRVGNVVSGKTGVGTALATGTPITDNFTVLTTSGGATAFLLPATDIGSGPVVVFNTSATTALVFPQSGETIDNGSSSASVNVAQNKTRMFWKVTATGWASLLTA